MRYNEQLCWSIEEDSSRKNEEHANIARSSIGDQSQWVEQDIITYKCKIGDRILHNLFSIFKDGAI